MRPLRLGRSHEVDHFLDEARIPVLEIGRAVGHRAARLRTEHRSLRLPDALSLASALENEAALLTFDERLQRVIDVVT